jgi:chromosome segregation ATPase
MAPQPDAKHLLDLLQRAAEELKASQKETSSARAEAKSLHDKLAAAEAALTEERRQRQQLADQLMNEDGDGSLTLPPGPLRADFTNKTVPIARSPLAKPREEKTSVGGGDDNLLGDRMKGLQDEIQQLEADRKQLKDRVKSLEEQLAHPDPESARRAGEMEHELSNTRQQLIVEQARGADLLTRLQAWEARSQELEHSLASSRTAGDEEHAQLETMAGQLSQVETELTTERARTQALEEQLKSLEQGSSDEQKRLFEATTRIAQLEVEASGLRSRRDELNVEIGKVEKERNAARTRAAELEHAAQQVRDQLNAEHAAAAEAERLKRADLEQQLAKEKEKHQITAQKLLEARGKGKEADERLHAGAAQNAELTARLEAMTKEHAAALDAARVAATEANAGLTARVAELTGQLETATAEWRHTDKQYEQLHKEMLVILDQRDEARRELDTIKQRFGIR